jgi:hypothetical protein
MDFSVVDGMGVRNPEERIGPAKVFEMHVNEHGKQVERDEDYRGKPDPPKQLQEDAAHRNPHPNVRLTIMDRCEMRKL